MNKSGQTISRDQPVFGISNRTFLIVIVLAAVALRIWGLDWGLPQVLHPDEPLPVTTAIYSVATNDWNPRAFHWPSLQTYLIGIEYEIWYRVGIATGAWKSGEFDFPPADGFIAYSMRAPAGFYYLGRLTTLVFGAGVVWMVFLLAARYLRPEYALLAAALAALHPILARHSRFVTPDIPAEFFFLAALYFIERFHTALTEPPGEHADAAAKLDGIVTSGIFASIMVGLGTGTKYPVAVLIVPLLGVVLFTASSFGVTSRVKLALRFIAVTIVTFLLTTPFALLDWRQFVNDILTITWHVRTGHIGMEAEGGIWMALLKTFIADSGWIWTIAGVAGLILFFRDFRKRWPLFIALAFVLFGLAPLDVFSDRYLVPLVPFWIIGIAWLTQSIVDSLKNSRKINLLAGKSIPIILLMFAATAGFGAIRLCSDAYRLTLPDTREYALVWIKENIPARSVIVKEQGGPDVFYINMDDPEPQDFEPLLPDPWYYGREITPLFARGGLYRDPLDTVLITLPDWIITSSQVRNRYMREGAQREFPGVVAAFREYYRLIDDYLVEEVRFTPGDGVVGEEVVIYSVPEGFWETLRIDEASVEEVLEGERQPGE